MKIDFKKTLDCYRASHGSFRVVDVPPLQYVAVDGQGDPNTSTDYSNAIAVLYPIAYALKFASKKDLGRDYVVMPLEALWWAENWCSFTSARDKSKWSWTAMIMVPDWIDRTMFQAAMDAVAKKSSPQNLGNVRFETLREGRCVQTLHIGSYDDEAPVLANLHERFVPDNGYRLAGKHHEIYLGDPRRVDPARLRTILRQPVA